MDLYELAWLILDLNIFGWVSSPANVGEVGERGMPFLKSLKSEILKIRSIIKLK